MSDPRDGRREYDEKHGTYKTEEQPEDARLPTGAVPKVDDAPPFNLGPKTSGERE